MRKILSFFLILALIVVFTMPATATAEPLNPKEMLFKIVVDDSKPVEVPGIITNGIIRFRLDPTFNALQLTAERLKLPEPQYWGNDGRRVVAEDWEYYTVIFPTLRESGVPVGNYPGCPYMDYINGHEVAESIFYGLVEVTWTSPDTMHISTV